MEHRHFEPTTLCLHRLSDGDGSAAAELMPLVYEEMRRLAGGYLNAERPDHTLQPTALVHEAYLKLVDQSRARWNDRAHFMAVAAQAMRRILIDHARGHRAAKRSAGGRRLTLDMASDQEDAMDVDLVALDEALRELETRSERQGQVVALRFFGGLNVEETGEVLGIVPRTVKRDWRVARAWLAWKLRGDPDPDADDD